MRGSTAVEGGAKEPRPATCPPEVCVTRRPAVGRIWMRTVTGHIVAWAICIAIGLIVGEIAGVIMFYRQQGQIVYFNQRVVEPTEQAKQAPPIGQRLHPYLG